MEQEQKIISPDRVYNLKEAKSLLGVDRTTLKKHLGENRIKTIKVKTISINYLVSGWEILRYREEYKNRPGKGRRPIWASKKYLNKAII